MVYILLLLFMIGAGIALVGTLKIGTLEVTGIRVRVAGLILCLPLFLSQFLAILSASVFGEDTSLISLFAFVELMGIGLASSVSYWLLMMDYEPQIPDKKIERPDFTPKKTDKPITPNRPKPPITPIQQAEQTATFAKMNDYPNIMNATEAANYLNISEDALIELIDAGKIAASIINYRYHISRIVLDEFSQAQD